MNNISLKARIKCAIVLVIFMILSIGPIPITSTIGMYIVIFRPRWFKEFVDRVYSD